MKIRSGIPALFAFVLGLPAAAAGQQPLPATAQHDTAQRVHSDRSLQILHVTAPPRLDGVLDDAAWTSADAARDFVQREPHEGMAGSEQTEVRVVSDGRNLFFGIMCFDTAPAAILARELRRDDPLENDDTFAVILDTFHDHRNAFLFRINPRGAQFDALVTDEGRHVNTTWRENWEVETHIGEAGWSAEIKIPLKSIRFAASDAQPAFGVDFERVIRRKNEFTYWTNHSRRYAFNQVSQSGHLAGVSGLQAGSRLRIKPYANTRVVSRGVGERDAALLGDVGLEDLKYSLTPSLTFDLTVNTDFAQTEVDEQVVNLDRVPVFFPEKREFFLEGAGLFEFGALRGENQSETKLYHSRRIGLSDTGAPVPIIAGAKLGGKAGENFTFGLLSVQTDRARGRVGENFSVVRLQRNVLARSTVGAFVTSRQASGSDFNRVFGADYNFVVLKHLTVRGVGARSDTNGVRDDQGLAGAAVEWDDDRFIAGFDYFHIEDNFRSDLGFVERVGVRRYAPRVDISPRPERGYIRQYSVGVRLDHYRRIADDTLLTEVYHFNHRMRFQDGSGYRFSPHRRTEDLRQPFRLPRGLMVPPGRYAWWYFPLTYNFNPAHRLTGTVQYRIEVDYFGKGGRLQTWNVNPVLKLNQHVSAGLDYGFNRIRLAGGTPVNVHVLNNRIDVSFNREWLTSTIFQYSNTRRLIGVNARLRYRYGPHDDLYVVVNSVGSGDDPLRDVDRSITLKLTRSFEF